MATEEIIRKVWFKEFQRESELRQITCNENRPKANDLHKINSCQNLKLNHRHSISKLILFVVCPSCALECPKRIILNPQEERGTMPSASVLLVLVCFKSFPFIHLHEFLKLCFKDIT